MTGSARKSAYVLRTEVENFIKAVGIERVLFVTLTFGGGGLGPTVKHAQKCFHSFNTHVLAALFKGGFKVLERGDKNGRVHFHLLVDAGCDVRTGTNFQELRDGVGTSLNENCRRAYGRMRAEGRKYGFGKVVHCEPVFSVGAALAGYLSKYIAKHIDQRRSDDKGARLWSRFGTAREKFVMQSCRFSWNSVGGWLYRAKLAQLANLVGVHDLDGMKERFGRSWAYRLKELIHAEKLTRYPSVKHAIADGRLSHEDAVEHWGENYPDSPLEFDRPSEEQRAAAIRERGERLAEMAQGKAARLRSRLDADTTVCTVWND